MQTMFRHANLLLSIVALAGLLFIINTRVRPDTATALPAPPSASANEPAPLVGHPAPDFTLADLDGNPVALSELRGQVLLINLWATWCPPCRAEMPAIQAVHDDFAAQGFEVLAVNVREDPATVARYMQQNNLSFPALLDSQGQVAADYRARVFPSSFFVDRNGIVRAVYLGPMSRSIIAGTVSQLLSEEGK